MKRWLPIIMLLCACVLPGCSTVSTRIAENPGAYDRLSPGERNLVRNGEIREGMGRQTVYLAWGKPDSVSRASAFGHPHETWCYLAYTTVPVDYGWAGFGGGFGPGYFRGNWGYYPIYQFNYASWGYPYRIATFVNGKVVAWSASDWP